MEKVKNDKIKLVPANVAIPVGGEHTRNVQLKEFFQFRCSRKWLGIGVAMGTLTAMTARRKGGLRLTTFATLGTVAAYSTMVEPRRPVLERVTLRIPDLPPALDGLRIGQLSDMHLGFPHGHPNTQWAVQQMVAEQPEVLVLTGDFVSLRRAIADLPALLRPLHAPLGIYAVPGNHDHWEGLEEIRTTLEPLGIVFLMNTNRRLLWNGAEWWLLGVDDPWYGQPDLEEALRGGPADGFKVLLSHAPDFADKAIGYRIALQLSGHTHGGHVHLPLAGWLCVPFHGLRYISGLEQVGDMLLYISRGLGGAPLRLNCRPEAAVLTLRRG